MHAIYHLELPPGPQWLFRLLQSLSGVPIFFIISGFLVADSYLRSSSSRGFAINRVLRIYPGLIVNIAILEAAVALTGGFSPSVSLLNYIGFFLVFAATASAPWAGYFFDSPYASSGVFTSYPSGVLWTLTVELTFYVTLPLILEAWRAAPRRGLFYLALFSALSLFVASKFNLGSRMDTFVSVSIGPYFWMFATGVTARLYWSRICSMFEGRAVWWFVAHVAALALSLVVGKSGAIYFADPEVLVITRVFILAGLTLSVAFTFVRPRLLRAYDTSYGVYLYHMLILQVMFNLGMTGRLRYWAVVFCGSLALGALSFILVERPCMRLREKIGRQPPREPSPNYTLSNSAILLRSD